MFFSLTINFVDIFISKCLFMSLFLITKHNHVTQNVILRSLYFSIVLKCLFHGIIILYVYMLHKLIVFYFNYNVISENSFVIRLLVIHLIHFLFYSFPTSIDLQDAVLCLVPDISNFMSLYYQ